MFKMLVQPVLGRFIVIGNDKQTGINRVRDIKPFVDDYGTVIEKMHKDCKITKGYKLHPNLQIVDANEKNIFFVELWEKALSVD